MSKKFKILILLFVLLVIVLGVTFVILESVENERDINPTSYPASYTNGNNINNGGNIINIGSEDLTKYKYAALAKDDTIRLYDSASNELIINLDKRNWSDLSWSPSYNLIAATGTTNNFRNLYIFNLQKRQWIVATNFLQGEGVTSYAWEDDDTILLTVNEGEDNWLESYKYSTLTQITKITKIEGEIESISTDGQKLVVKTITSDNEPKYELYSTQGELLYSLMNILDQDDKVVNVKRAIFTKDPDKLILGDSESVYKHQFGTSEAIKLLNIKKLLPLCAVTKDIVLGFIIEGDAINIQSINVKDDMREDYLSTSVEDLVSLDYLHSSCYNSKKPMIRILASGGVYWYSVAPDGGFNDFKFLEGAKEVWVNDNNY